MNRLCDRVDLLLRENKELSARLRNLEYLSGSGSSRRTFTSSPRNSFQQSPNRVSLDSSGSAEPFVQPDVSAQSHATCHACSSMSNPHNHGSPRLSAFEEQLHWSRVYRHAHANHSESSLTVDSRSALAFSMCSSLTLGDVSKISVFALPVFADDLSNPSAYTFAPPSDFPQIIHPNQVRADVAISVTNDEGQQHVCGYVPLVVGKICVFLKENGMHNRSSRLEVLSTNSHQPPMLRTSLPPDGHPKEFKTWKPSFGLPNGTVNTSTGPLTPSRMPQMS